MQEGVAGVGPPNPPGWGGWGGGGRLPVHHQAPLVTIAFEVPGTSWLLLTNFGRCWPLLALWATFGQKKKRPVLLTFASFWLLLGCYWLSAFGHLWPLFVLHSHPHSLQYLSPRIRSSSRMPASNEFLNDPMNS